MSRAPTPPGQLGFDALLADAQSANQKRLTLRHTEGMPESVEDALPIFRALLEEHHAAMLAAKEDEVKRLRRRAHYIALKLNGGEAGILADEDAPGCVLTRASAAPVDEVPIWGQAGDFEIDAAGMRVRIVVEGIFGLGCGSSFWPGFSAHAVDLDKPFLSETGFRSFLGIYAEPRAHVRPDEFAIGIVSGFVYQHLKGKLLGIMPRAWVRQSGSS